MATDPAGRPEQPYPGLESAADTGETNAVYRYGLQLRAAGHEHKTHERDLRAIEPDSPSRPHVLGLLFAGDDDRTEAEVWRRRAAELGDTRSAFHLGALPDEHGDAAQAER
ncbi:hypothetical protein AB0N62_29070 [Streptomyces sp. NPDC093982]|uniref:hypothetical protein n=1 Tax=Streptomyces sp. NPDC093982 TaxID=3155077 RepID=UPI0034410CC2